MTTLVVRRLLIDLEKPIARHWCGGDAFLSAWFNALSMSFPLGEQFFIDSVRGACDALPADKKARHQEEVAGFIGQEATHRRIHALFNGHLQQHGLVNAWEARARERMKMFEGQDPRHALAVTAAHEHLTAIFADWILRHHSRFDACEPRLKTMWLWHGAEEAEHRNTAFDIYQALDGAHRWRIKWFRRVTLMFLCDLLRQTIDNLRRDRSLWRWQTWRSAIGHLFGSGGLLRETWRPWRAYFRRDFHPGDLQSDLSQRWLADNAAQYLVVGK